VIIVSKLLTEIVLTELVEPIKSASTVADLFVNEVIFTVPSSAPLITNLELELNLTRFTCAL
jgi:hypothetical protein